MRTLKQIRDDCENCSETLTVEKMRKENTCAAENCKIKNEYVETHKALLCSECSVFGCANNPEGTGSAGAILYLSVPDECTMLEGDSSI